MPSGKLTTHILDTAHGRPGAGMAMQLFALEDGSRHLLGNFTSNADGRCDAPLLMAESMNAGVYEIDFHAGDYFRALGVVQTEPMFLDRITLRFGISDPDAHYHVPLLVSPFSYSTYRGS